MSDSFATIRTSAKNPSPHNNAADFITATTSSHDWPADKTWKNTLRTIPRLDISCQLSNLLSAVPQIVCFLRSPPPSETTLRTIPRRYFVSAPQPFFPLCPWLFFFSSLPSETATSVLHMADTHTKNAYKKVCHLSILLPILYLRLTFSAPHCLKKPPRSFFYLIYKHTYVGPYS